MVLFSIVHFDISSIILRNFFLKLHILEFSLVNQDFRIMKNILDKVVYIFEHSTKRVNPNFSVKLCSYQFLMLCLLLCLYHSLMFIRNGQIYLFESSFFESVKVIQIAWVAFLEGHINTQDLAISILIHSDTSQQKTGDYLVVFTDEEVYHISKEINVVVF